MVSRHNFKAIYQKSRRRQKGEFILLRFARAFNSPQLETTETTSFPIQVAALPSPAEWTEKKNQGLIPPRR